LSASTANYGFSVLIEIKSKKKRERLLGIDEKVRVCLKMMESHFDPVCSQKQSHP